MPKTFKEFLNEEVKFSKRELTSDIHHLGVKSQYKLASNGKRHDDLIHSTHDEVRRLVAQHGNDKHRDHLMHDQAVIVRDKVAMHGNDKHRDHLMHDKNSLVREIVAIKGNHKHKKHLKKDSSKWVRYSATRPVGEE